MTRQRVELTPEQREIACNLMAEALAYHHVELIDLCVGKRHWHTLARYCSVNQVRTRKRDPRHLMGIAKKHSARIMSDQGIAPTGGIWAARCKVLPIKDRKHQLNVARYIPDHAKKGAAVYSLIKKHMRNVASEGI